MEEDRITLMCPKCGYVKAPLLKYSSQDCDCCGEAMIKINFDGNAFFEAQEEEELQMLIKIYRKFLYNNPKYDKETFEKRLEEEEEEEKGFQKQLDEIRAKSYADNNPRCPKCGSTAIQAVPRKWGLFAGIFTNKVDRVCLNCKNKF